jgi:cytosine/adenosine deaminase-related metal-dependent hydrolase
MRHLSADLIYPINAEPLPKGIITIADNGTILEISPEGTYHPDDIAHYKGLLCPGFIDAHCHIELSHLQDQIPPYIGLANFLRPIAQIRQQFDADTIQRAIADAESNMLRNGIVAVGDISNDNSSFAQKLKGNLRYHTFIEILVPFGNEQSERVAEKMRVGIDLYQQSPRNNGNTASLAPHAPYTVPPELFYQIDEFNQQHGLISSLHHQESPAENELFYSGTGDFVELYRSMGVDIQQYCPVIAQNSSSYVLKSLKKSPQQAPRLLLVHNTYSTEADIIAMQQSNKPLTWVFCPNANRYIENRLPNFDFFRRQNAHIAIGTDSLASNWQLCILSELKQINQYAPHIPLQELLTWATLNGATALGYDKELGSFEVSKCPGVLNISRIDLENRQITPESAVRRIV